MKRMDGGDVRTLSQFPLKFRVQLQAFKHLGDTDRLNKASASHLTDQYWNICFELWEH